jgi:hypothetical protein
MSGRVQRLASSLPRRAQRASAAVRWRARVAGAAAAVALPAALLGLGEGFPVSRVDVTTGAAWMATPGEGLVTLVDGLSEQVVGSVKVPFSSDEFEVVPAGTSALAFDPRTGAVVRIDGATYESSPSTHFTRKPGEAPGGRFDVLVGADSMFVVDRQRQVVAVADPETLRRKGDPVSLSADPGEGQQVVDASGRLWLVDGRDGELLWLDQGGALQRRDVDARSRLLIVQGEPVRLDLAGRATLARLSRSGEAEDGSCLEVRADEIASGEVQLLGSSSSPRVYAAVAGSGRLVIAQVATDDCTHSVEVGAPGSTFGRLAEVPGHVFVPDSTSGVVQVVNTETRATTEIKLVPAGHNLQVIAHSGLVFYNDLNGTAAGVLRFKNGEWVAGRSLTKYTEAQRGGRNLLGAGDGDGDGGRGASGELEGLPPPPKQPDQRQRPPTERPDETDARDPPNRPQRRNGSIASHDRRPGGSGGRTGSTLVPPRSPSPQPATISPSPSPPVVRSPDVRSIHWAEPVYKRRPLVFSATVDNADGASWHWTLGNEAGEVISEGTSVGSFSTTGPLVDDWDITLEVEGPGGRDELRKIGTTSSDLPVPKITSLVASPNPAEVGEEVSISGVEAVMGDRGSWRWSVWHTTICCEWNRENIPGTPGTPLLWTFPAEGQFGVRLVVEVQDEEGWSRSDEETVFVDVKPERVNQPPEWVDPPPPEIRRSVPFDSGPVQVPFSIPRVEDDQDQVVAQCFPAPDFFFPVGKKTVVECSARDTGKLDAGPWSFSVFVEEAPPPVETRSSGEIVANKTSLTHGQSSDYRVHLPAGDGWAWNGQPPRVRPIMKRKDASVTLAHWEPVRGGMDVVVHVGAGECFLICGNMRIAFVVEVDVVRVRR